MIYFGLRSLSFHPVFLFSYLLSHFFYKIFETRSFIHDFEPFGHGLVYEHVNRFDQERGCTVEAKQ